MGPFLRLKESKLRNAGFSRRVMEGAIEDENKKLMGRLEGIYRGNRLSVPHISAQQGPNSQQPRGLAPIPAENQESLSNVVPKQQQIRETRQKSLVQFKSRKLSRLKPPKKHVESSSIMNKSETLVMDNNDDNFLEEVSPRVPEMQDHIKDLKAAAVEMPKLKTIHTSKSSMALPV